MQKMRNVQPVKHYLESGDPLYQIFHYMRKLCLGYKTIESYYMDEHFDDKR